MTPGAVRTTERERDLPAMALVSCAIGTGGRDDRIMAEYGSSSLGLTRITEIDHLVPLGIGGADAERQPVARTPPDNRTSLERRGQGPPRVRSCAIWCVRGALGVATAQHMMGEDWVEAYGPVLPFAGQRLRARCRGNDAATGAITLAIRLAILALAIGAPLYEWRTRRDPSPAHLNGDAAFAALCRD